MLKTDKDKIYVKWRGYNSSFNNWIDKSTATKYIKMTHTIYINVTVFFNFLYLKMTHTIYINVTIYKF